MDFFLGLSLKLLVRLLVRWTLRSRTTERTRVIVLGHMTQWGHCNRSYDSMSVVSVPPETDRIGKWPQSLCNEQRPASGKHVSKSDFNCDGQNHFLVIVSRGVRLSRKKPGWESILLVTNPCSGTPGKDYTYIVRNWYILTNRFQSATFDSTEGLLTELLASKNPKTQPY